MLWFHYISETNIFSHSASCLFLLFMVSLAVPKLYFFNFYFYFILLYNTVLVLPYIDMNPPWVYMSSQTWTPPATPYHLSGSSPCTSPKHPVSCIKHRLAIRFLHGSIHVSMPFSQIIPHSPSPSPSESKSHSTHLCLFCCLAYRVIITIFLNSIYMC